MMNENTPFPWGWTLIKWAVAIGIVLMAIPFITSMKISSSPKKTTSSAVTQAQDVCAKAERKTITATSTIEMPAGSTLWVQTPAKRVSIIDPHKEVTMYLGNGIRFTDGPQGQKFSSSKDKSEGTKYLRDTGLSCIVATEDTTIDVTVK